MHEFEENPDTLIEFVHIFACNYVLTVERFDQTALVDDALAFCIANTCIFENTLVLIGESSAFEYGGESATSDLFLNLIEILRIKLLHRTCVSNQLLNL